jgi:hypothetical protein
LMVDLHHLPPRGHIGHNHVPVDGPGDVGGLVAYRVADLLESPRRSVARGRLAAGCRTRYRPADGPVPIYRNRHRPGRWQPCSSPVSGA